MTKPTADKPHNTYKRRQESRQAIREYVEQTNEPTLEDLVSKKQLIMREETHKSTIHAINNTKKRFMSALCKKQSPALLDNRLSMKMQRTAWLDVFDPLDNYEIDAERHFLFQWAYLVVQQGGMDRRIEFEASHQNDIEAIVSKPKKTLKDHLNLMSVKLLRYRYEEVEPSFAIKEALKLSLSLVVDLSHPTFNNIFETELDKDVFDELLTKVKTDDVLTLSQNDKDNMRDTIRQFTHQSMEKNEFSFSLRPTLIDQVKRLLIHLLTAVKGWEKTNEYHEGMYTFYLYDILKVLFDDTDIQLINGETCSDCSKEMKALNYRFYGVVNGATGSSSNNNRVMGKKTDIIVKSRNNKELSVIELKNLVIKYHPPHEAAPLPLQSSTAASTSNTAATNSITANSALTTLSVLEQEKKNQVLGQHCKNIRTNASICHRYKKNCVGMNFKGNCGASFELKQFQDCLVCLSLGHLRLPMNVNSLYNRNKPKRQNRAKLAQILKTLLQLYTYKAHVLKLDQELENIPTSTTEATTSKTPFPQIFNSPRVKPASSSPASAPPLSI